MTPVACNSSLLLRAVVVVKPSVNVHMPAGQVLLTLLCGRSGGGASSGLHPFRVRALACRCLQGLARDPAMRSILGTLQVSS